MKDADKPVGERARGLVVEALVEVGRYPLPYPRHTRGRDSFLAASGDGSHDHEGLCPFRYGVGQWAVRGFMG
jgi:hypothetical protein